MWVNYTLIDNMEGMRLRFRYCAKVVASNLVHSDIPRPGRLPIVVFLLPKCSAHSTFLGKVQGQISLPIWRTPCCNQMAEGSDRELQSKCWGFLMGSMVFCYFYIEGASDVMCRKLISRRAKWSKNRSAFRLLCAHLPSSHSCQWCRSSLEMRHLMQVNHHP